MIRKEFNVLTYITIGLIIIISIFKFQYSLITGPFLGGLLFFLVLILGFIFSIVFIFVNRRSGVRTILPLAGLIFSFLISLGGLDLGISYKLHYWLNKSEFQKLEAQIERNPNLIEMTDMLRYSKRINSKHHNNHKNYRTKKYIKSVFGTYLITMGINVDLIFDIRKRMEHLKIISFIRTESSLCLTVDGMIDNEYGFIKFYGKVPEVGEGADPYGFTLISLIHVGDDWYYFATS